MTAQRCEIRECWYASLDRIINRANAARQSDAYLRAPRQFHSVARGRHRDI